MEFIRGSYSNRTRIVREAVGFRNILHLYRTSYPEFGLIGHVFDESARGVMALMSVDRWLQEIPHRHSRVDRQQIRNGLVVRAARELSNRAEEVMKSHVASIEEIEKELSASDVNGIPSWDAAISVATEYLKDNVGSSRRNLLESDLRDIMHLRCLPYVDYCVTDTYFSDLARRIGGKLRARILKNSFELAASLVESSN